MLVEVLECVSEVAVFERNGVGLIEVVESVDLTPVDSFFEEDADVVDENSEVFDENFEVVDENSKVVDEDFEVVDEDSVVVTGIIVRISSKDDVLLIRD